MIKFKNRTSGKTYESMTDTSHYKPNVSKLNNIAGADGNGGGLYEFPDGKDNGDRYYVLRSLGADRVDIDNEIKRIKTDGENAKKEVIEMAEKDMIETYNKAAQKKAAEKTAKETAINASGE